MFESVDKPGPTSLVIFGGAGDLSQSKLVPAIYNLMLDEWLPEDFALIAVSHHDRTTGDLREILKEGVEEYSRRSISDNNQWEKLADAITYYKADFTTKKDYKGLADKLDEHDEKWEAKANRILYLSVSPQFIAPIAKNINEFSIADNPDISRLIVEKPFGKDYESAKQLNHKLTRHFKEKQIYRIDHYLGKETVQNILAFRFANAFFEPIWNSHYIDNIQITVSEAVGVEHRGNYYDDYGALRDMVQNHLMQLLCMVAMEPPVTYKAEEMHNRKLDVLNAVRPFSSTGEVKMKTVRGQYDSGQVEGEKRVAYRNAERVDEDSDTETFAALKLNIDNWRWQSVPFYLRTGKSLKEKHTSISIQFKPISHQLFPCEVSDTKPNVISINIQPEMGVNLGMQAKKPGLRMLLEAVDMNFDYQDNFDGETPEAYETLLLDAMQGDSTLFMRGDQVEKAWEIITPVLEQWLNIDPSDFPNYDAGSWGPDAAHKLLEDDGRKWLVT
jgi:glucose-6-phosphate 1-dehydrogenase